MEMHFEEISNQKIEFNYLRRMEHYFLIKSNHQYGGFFIDFLKSNFHLDHERK